MALSDQDFDLLAAAKEPLIETRSGERVYETVIWVAASTDTLFVRSFRGDSGRWYQRAVSNPGVALIVGDVRVEFQAIAATDDESIHLASEGFLSKYQKGSSLDGMVHAGVLHTTLRLDPTL